MHGERSISWLPRVCSCELLEPSAPRQEKLMDVSFISVSCSVCELRRLGGSGVNECLVRVVVVFLGSYSSVVKFAPGRLLSMVKTQLLFNCSACTVWLNHIDTVVAVKRNEYAHMFHSSFRMEWSALVSLLVRIHGNGNRGGITRLLCNVFFSMGYLQSVEEFFSITMHTSAPLANPSTDSLNYAKYESGEIDGSQKGNIRCNYIAKRHFIYGWAWQRYRNTAETKELKKTTWHLQNT